MSKRILIISTIFLCFTSAKAQPPQNARAVYYQGIAFMDKAQYPDAMASFFKATILYKNYDSAYFQMAEINMRYSSFDTAISYYKKALAINPKYMQALINIGGAYKNFKNDINTGLGYYLKAIEIDSTNKETWYYAAWCYNALKDYDNAIRYAVKALSFDNNYRMAYGELGHAFHLSGKFAEGVVQFKKNIAVSPNELPMYYAGLCYVELKDKVGATSMYDELVKISSMKMANALKQRIDKLEN